MKGTGVHDVKLIKNQQKVEKKKTQIFKIIVKKEGLSKHLCSKRIIQFSLNTEYWAEGGERQRKRDTHCGGHLAREHLHFF